MGHSRLLPATGESGASSNPDQQIPGNSLRGSGHLLSHQGLCVADSLEPGLPIRSRPLDQRLISPDSSPVVGLGAEHLPMPLALAHAQLAKDGRLLGIDMATLVSVRQSSRPVDQIDLVFGRDGQEVLKHGYVD